MIGIRVKGDIEYDDYDEEGVTHVNFIGPILYWSKSEGVHGILTGVWNT